MGTYVFDQAWARERERLTALEDLYDDQSLHRLAALGVAEGWRCLEVGCGAGSVARWLADRVGPSGRVLATDFDPRFAEGHGLPNLDVRRHDILVDPLDDDAYDLVHARAVLEHVPRRELALERMVAATRPGGWVVVEDFDIGGPMTVAAARYYPEEHAELAERLGRALERLFTERGVDASLGRRLPEMLASAGLTDVAAEVRAPVLSGGSQDFFRLTLERLRPGLVAGGLLEDAELDRFLDLLTLPAFRYAPNFMVIAWGRRPEPA
ncbi:Ubiquinone/menaquinone biosynthesis C-methylase UbiE [Streptoalloteichus tenebrarius]|uniref:Ubiquinone/menaquinone biosynthesis C-methylase UbiE n=1 Tax=Streptoalloteichus tenebrarius (strain ATCC 17920 / DSM 40477 / JCM 4838 / CBS 697.72 / NBRC 16177 / NCIMB 11028 / NRRL B-12390 / A12253. 1 / ISP 5477) TaxID=1933 RepID=A0ABT1I1Y2_STRSD|nr:methyltransferase [Streptoalloteichus tenebrarius]MCP2261743.1 Ubiquinone/menaquinone biosynthesis C-methylase UbiE [Streptoalloteichus tenebrarius]BFF00798.1 methyltransferase domain-containing protein [Streptoalloteichus tenebrarius]